MGTVFETQILINLARLKLKLERYEKIQSITLSNIMSLIWFKVEFDDKYNIGHAE